jgi:2'-5' RNA ligase
MRTIGVAIDVPEPWGTYLRKCRAATGDPQADYVPTHLTLLPPTELAEGTVPEVREHLARVSAVHRPFSLYLRGTGTFRPVTDVVFVAVAAGIGECERLAADVRSGPLGLDSKFPYHPHVTVAHDVESGELDRVFETLADFEARFEVDRFTLYEHADRQWRSAQEYPLSAPPAAP